MDASNTIVFEQHVEEEDGPTIGWLARYGEGQSIWCGEISRATFKSQPASVREGLRDDLGWFLVDCDGREPATPRNILGKAACEKTALELVNLIVQGRLAISRARIDPKVRTSVIAKQPVIRKFGLGAF